MKPYRNILDLIGNTPLIRLNHINPNPDVIVLAKLESCNPGGSIKDRAALKMIEAAEESGELTHDKIIIEATSGNTGIGLALVTAAKGYRLVLTMPESASIERQKILKAYGAELLLTTAELATDGSIEKAYSLVREFPDKYFTTDQFNNPNNPLAHYENTAPEIWEQTHGLVTHIITTLGTSGTAMGISRFFREKHPHVKITGIEPEKKHRIQGLKNMLESYQPGIYDKTVLSEHASINTEEAFEMTRRLAREEGIFAGMSSGAAIHVAIEKAKTLKNGVIVAILPDGGERYLSTDLFTYKPQRIMRLYNTVTRKKEDFSPLKEGNITMYTCGPTVDGDLRLTEARRYLVADLLKRYLGFKGIDVTHVINITDLDDRTIKGAQDADMDIREFTGQYVSSFFNDMEKLDIVPADRYPKASEHITDTIEAVSRLVEKGFAYEKLRSVYFNILKSTVYGNLSGIDLTKIKEGYTVDLDEYEKDNPKDFTLLKRSKLNELKKGIYYRSPWGSVRPGWHIQCAVMSMKYLGNPIDIHTGNSNLVFPHHENEVAIAEALTGKPFVRHWVHNESLTIDKDSSLYDENTTVKSIIKQGVSWRELRYLIITSHYRKSLKISDKAILSARNAIAKQKRFIAGLTGLSTGLGTQEVKKIAMGMRKDFIASMDDDLNISKALSCISTAIKKVNTLLASGHVSADEAKEFYNELKAINNVLNIFNLEPGHLNDNEKEIYHTRLEAKANGDWEKADKLRDELKHTGVMVMDTEKGAWWYRDDL